MRKGVPWHPPGGCHDWVSCESERWRWDLNPRKGCPFTRFRVLRTTVHRCPSASVACANTIRAVTGERWRTAVNETKTEPRPGPGPELRCDGESLNGSSAACVVVTGRRQRFVLHAIPNRADRRIGIRRERRGSAMMGAPIAWLCRVAVAAGARDRGASPGGIARNERTRFGWQAVFSGWR